MHASRFNLTFTSPRAYGFLLLNTLSGAADLVDRRALDVLASADTDALQGHPEFCRYCLERGYLFASTDAEVEAIEAAHQRTLELYRAEPFRAHVHLTYLCNLRCSYCFQSHRLHGRGSLFPSDAIPALFTAIGELSQRWASPQPPTVTLFGGEPLLQRASQVRVVAAILDACSERGYRIGIVTNGVDLSGYVDLLAPHAPEFVQVTLDGPKEVHDQRRVFADGEGSFDYVVAGIDAAVARGLHVIVRVNVDRRNVESLPDLADFILARGWTRHGVVVGVAPVDEFVPESEWCAEQTRIDTLQALLEVLHSHEQTGFMVLGHRLAQVFEHLLTHGCLPAASFRYCPATIGNQMSFDHEGRIFACC